MGKVAKVKKREPTFHSRAHRRNASPPPQDMAVKALAVDEETEYKPWLHNAQNAGIIKKKRGKPLTRQQKMRQQKALEKADANLDKLATKVQASKARGRKVQARRAGWEDLNGGAAVVEGAKVAGDGDWEDEAEEGGKDVEVNESEKNVELDVGMEEAETTKLNAEAQAMALPEPDEDEEL